MSVLRSDDGHRLIGFGLSIDSDRDVPGALAGPAPGDRAIDLRIRTLPHLPGSQPPQPIYAWDGETLTFAPPRVARYYCCRNEIAIAADPQADPDMVTALLIATALPAVMWLRGDAMLHAALVAPPAGGPALAIAGRSGIGKSTLAAQLLDAGGALVADDSVRLRRHGDVIEGSGLPGGYHMARADAAARDFHPVSRDRTLPAAPVGAVVILSWGEGEPALVRLDPLAALERLLANRHRPRVPAIIGRRAQALAAMGAVARHCQIYQWRRSSAALSAAERALLAGAGLW